MSIPKLALDVDLARGLAFDFIKWTTPPNSGVNEWTTAPTTWWKFQCSQMLAGDRQTDRQADKAHLTYAVCYPACQSFLFLAGSHQKKKNLLAPWWRIFFVFFLLSLFLIFLSFFYQEKSCEWVCQCSKTCCILGIGSSSNQHQCLLFKKKKLSLCLFYREKNICLTLS